MQFSYCYWQTPPLCSSSLFFSSRSLTSFTPGLVHISIMVSNSWLGIPPATAAQGYHHTHQFIVHFRWCHCHLMSDTTYISSSSLRVLSSSPAYLLPVPDNIIVTCFHECFISQHLLWWLFLDSSHRNVQVFTFYSSSSVLPISNIHSPSSQQYFVSNTTSTSNSSLRLLLSSPAYSWKQTFHMNHHSCS